MGKAVLPHCESQVHVNKVMGVYIVCVWISYDVSSQALPACVFPRLYIGF